MAHSNQHRGFTPRDYNNGSGIYFRHTSTRDLTERGNRNYTPADHRKEHRQGKEKPNEKEAPITKPLDQTSTQVANLPLVRVSYNAHILTTTTRTVLTQSFHHPGKAPIDEATYCFPLYASCSVVSFVCHVGPKKVITGVVQPKKIAKATYEKAKSQGHTAGLLEEFTPEVFKTSLGNIPAGVTVKVEIAYLTELKHDAKVDGIRFTVPTSIAPRYGDPPEGLFGDGYEARAEEGVSFSIDVTMGERIRTIESPSHPVSVQLGAHKVASKRTNTANQHDDKKALVTLSQRSMHLRGDFVLLVTTATPKFLCTPMALLEAHPTIPGQQALMVTLVPHFSGLKSTPKREIIFIVDRSGSMEPRIAPLKSAVSVFIKSLPIGCKFNICSFGSNYSFLWEKSQDYSAHTVKVALGLVGSFDGEMGGTELLQPIRETVRRRLEDMNTEVIVLTDGEIWEEQQVLGFIKQATEDSKGKLRFFSIGLGSEVSHSLVEGIARTGGGYSQIVADGSDEHDTGGWEGKLVKMLKAALTEHVGHYNLKVIHEGFHETDEEDSEDEEEPTSPSAIAPGTAKTGKSTTLITPQAPKKLLLFNPNEDPDTPGTPPSDDELLIGRPAAMVDLGISEDRFSHLKRLENPEILQAPYQIPALYSQVRTVAYLLISPTGDRLLRNPTSVQLRGTASGVEIEQSIPITRLDEPGLTIHQLAARMALKDLEDGSSWLHSGRYGTKPEDDTFREYVEREGEFLSIKWGLASKWASFVAVEDEFLEKEATGKAIAKAKAKKSRGEGSSSGSDGSGDAGGGYVLAGGGSGAGTLEATSVKTPVTDKPKQALGAHSLGGEPSTPGPIVALSLVKAPPPLALVRKIPGAFSVIHTGHDSMSMLLQPRDQVADGDWDQLTSSPLAPSNSGAIAVPGGALGVPAPVQDTVAHSKRPSFRLRERLLEARNREDRIQEQSLTRYPAIYSPPYSYSDFSGNDIIPARMATRNVFTRGSGSGNTFYGGYNSGNHPHSSDNNSFFDSAHNYVSSPSYKGQSPSTSSNPSKNDTPHQKIVRIISLQEFMGSFPLTEEMAHLIGLELPHVEKLAKKSFPDKATDGNKSLAMTSLVVAYLELGMHEHEDTWQMVVEKAHEFMKGGCERVEALKEKAEEIIEKKVLKVSHPYIPGVVNANSDMAGSGKAEQAPCGGGCGGKVRTRLKEDESVPG